MNETPSLEGLEVVVAKLFGKTISWRMNMSVLEKT